ncbi:outer membrane beta-barrel family protein [Chitinophaga sp. LS1]|uniref:outer membrane beta-barrel family protein n=1 Tax=Chitinophaga sp. LS1 TaxID=3051176 RepID=UPI002AAAD10E|nr:outer membrane beta-barrel family protein [Chitinophaga sp. LS1]WPV63997.1 outer membrane beta-barrel family protein [Chitinophaga sp. LS1]
MFCRRLRIVIVILFFFHVSLSYAQITLKGRILDSSSNAKIELVTVKLKSAKSATAIISSDSMGNYSFYQLVAGNYMLTCSFLNYTEKTIALSLSRDTVIDITLTQVLKQLKTVNINGRKPIVERRIDRLVFNVSDNMNAIGSDVLELLSKTPQVKVEGNLISIIGKDGVTVMINDRPLQMSAEVLAAYLKSLSAESVESIEIMTNPPSIYSAEGSSGIINIILKKKKEIGYTGVMNGNFRKGRSEGGRIGLNMNYNRSKFRYFGNFSLSRGAQVSISTSATYYSALTEKDSNKIKELSQYVNTQIGFDTDLSPNDQLGASAGMFFSFPYQTSVARSVFYNNESFKTDSVSNQYNSSKVSYKSFLANIHYVRILDTIHHSKIVIDWDWNKTIFDRPNIIDNTMYDSTGEQMSDRYSRTISNNNESSDFYSLNGVVFFPGDGRELSLGSRLNFINNNNDVLLIISHPSFNTSDIFSFTENTQALFINYRKKISEHWTIQSGLRGENTQTKGHSYGTIDSINTNHYFKLFPTLYIQYTVNDKNVITVDYGRRISRPSFSALNPYLRYFTQYEAIEGNPLLKPSISNNFSLSETFNNNLILTVQYSYTNSKYDMINIVQEDTRYKVGKFYNYLSKRYFQVSASYSVDMIKWLQNQNEMNVYYEHSISHLALTAPITAGWGATFNSHNTAFLNGKRTISGGFDFTYQFKDVSGIDRSGSYYFFNVSARYLLLKSKLQLALDIYDLFKTKIVTYSEIVNGILTTNKINSDSRRVGINVRYNFGNNKLKRGQAHSEENNSGRIGG